MNESIAVLNTWGDKARTLHDRYLEALINKQCSKMSESQHRLSSALNAIESLAFWRTQVEMLGVVSSPLSQSAFTQLTRAIERYGKCSDLNQGVEDFLLHAEALVNAEESKK